MPRLDDRLRNELARMASPPSPDVTATFERIAGRARRRRLVFAIERSALVLAVVAGSVAGFLVLDRAFRAAAPPRFPTPARVPIVAHANGMLAFGDGTAIRTIDPDGSRERSIPLPVSGGWLPSWSPDGSRLAVTIFPSKGPRQLWVMDADGSRPRKVAEASNVSQASWSPDGDWLVYAADSGSGSTLHLVRPDGTDDHIVSNVITHRDYFSASFSPDGSRILYDAGTDAGFAIFAMDTDGTHVRRLSAGSSDYEPGWSPDGTRILFTRQEAAMESDLFVMNADGSDPTRLTRGGEGDTNLDGVFSPDGTKIAYIAGVTGGGGPIVVMNADGSDPETVAKVDALGLDWQPRPRRVDDAISGYDPGTGHPVCDVARIDGNYWGDGTPEHAFLFSNQLPSGRCPAQSEGFTMLGVGLDQRRSVLLTTLQCPTACSFFATPDIDGDGRSELAVEEGGGDRFLFRLYEVSARGNRLVRIGVPGGEGDGGDYFAWGTYGSVTEGVRCATDGAGHPLLRGWVAHPANPTGYRIATTTFQIDPGGSLVDARSSSRIVPSIPSDWGTSLCGSPLLLDVP